MNKKRVVLAGGSGFLGQALARELLQHDYEVVVLTRELRERDEEDEVREVEWDGEHIGEWIKCLDGAETVVNLAGRNINCRHTPENLREITESRVNAVRAIATIAVTNGVTKRLPTAGIRWRKSARFGNRPCTLPPHSTPAACCSESAWCWVAMAGHCPYWPI
jgi:nucleoside-diphosphate-sugar epimerase